MKNDKNTSILSKLEDIKKEIEENMKKNGGELICNEFNTSLYYLAQAINSIQIRQKRREAEGIDDDNTPDLRFKDQLKILRSRAVKNQEFITEIDRFMDKQRSDFDAVNFDKWFKNFEKSGNYLKYKTAIKEVKEFEENYGKLKK